MSHPIIDICQEQFEICDICLNPDDVLIPDCSCGRAICTKCFNQSLTFNAKYARLPSAIFEQDESLKLMCHECIRKEKFCWICRLGENDSLEPLVDCPECFISLHESCINGFGHYECTMHHCKKCYEIFSPDTMDTMIQMTCYTCLQSFHVECFTGMFLDYEERITACICTECLARMGIGNSIVNKEYVTAWIKKRRRYNHIISSAMFLIEKELFSSPIDNWLHAYRREVVAACGQSTASHEPYLLYITTVVCQRHDKIQQDVLYNLLRCCNYSREITYEGLSFNFFHKIALVFEAFYLLCKNKAIPEHIISMFGLDFIESQRLYLNSLMRKMVKKQKGNVYNAESSETTEEIKFFDAKYENSLITCLFSIPASRNLEFPTIIALRQERTPSLTSWSERYPTRAVNAVYGYVFSSDSSMKLLDYMLGMLPTFPVDELEFILVCCYAIFLNEESAFQELCGYFASSEIDLIRARWAILEEPIQKPELDDFISEQNGDTYNTGFLEGPPILPAIQAFPRELHILRKQRKLEYNEDPVISDAEWQSSSKTTEPPSDYSSEVYNGINDALKNNSSSGMPKFNLKPDAIVSYKKEVEKAAVSAASGNVGEQYNTFTMSHVQNSNDIEEYPILMNEPNQLNVQKIVILPQQMDFYNAVIGLHDTMI